MSARRKPEAGGPLIAVRNGMDELDILDERLDRLLDRLNDLWDRAVGLDAEPAPSRAAKGVPKKKV